MKLAIVSDEISRDFATAVEIGRSWGIDHYELRRLSTGRIPHIDDSDIKEIEHCRKESGIAITSLSSGLFKIKADDAEVERRIAEDLPRTCELARQFGTDIVVEFGFLKPEMKHRGPAPEQVIELFGRIADVTQSNGCRLMLENEHICWADTGAATAEILKRVNHPNLYVNWDPTNASHFDETVFPDGYAAVKDRVAHVHIKDFDAEDDSITVVPGQGGTNWPAQLRALIDDGYDGRLVVETHMRPKVEMSRRCVAAVKDMLVALCGE